MKSGHCITNTAARMYTRMEIIMYLGCLNETSTVDDSKKDLLEWKNIRL